MFKNYLLILVVIFTSISHGADRFKKIHVKDLEKILQSENKVYLYDANVESTRNSVGVIPGSKLVEVSDDYNLLKDLPSDKKSRLVFYCANEMCTASHMAAERAIDYGYRNVSVMIDGIYGWQKAGKKTDFLKKDSNPHQNQAAIQAVEVSPNEAYKKMSSKQAIIVDVREEEERHEVIEGALWFPMSKSSRDKNWETFIKSLPRDKEIIFHCAAGFRSKKVAEKLSQQGFRAGYFKGPDQWKEAGLPIKNE